MAIYRNATKKMFLKKAKAYLATLEEGKEREDFLDYMVMVSSDLLHNPPTDKYLVVQVDEDFLVFDDLLKRAE